VLIAELLPYQHKTVILNLKDGEISTVKILSVETEDDDIIVEIIHTNNPGQYKAPANSVYLIPASDVASVNDNSN
jgi:hypothetical protein